MIKSKLFSDLERFDVDEDEVCYSESWGKNGLTRLRNYPKSVRYWDGDLLIYSPQEYPYYKNYDIYDTYGFLDGDSLNDRGLKFLSDQRYYCVELPEELRRSYNNDISDLYKQFPPRVIKGEDWKDVDKSMIVNGRWHIYGCGGGDGGGLIFEMCKPKYFEGSNVFSFVNCLDNDDPINQGMSFMLNSKKIKKLNF